MTDKKIEIEFGIDGRVTGPLATSLRQAHDFAAEIERMFGRTADLGKEMSKQLAQIKAQNKALSAGLGGVSGGAPVSRVINANTSGRNADGRADKRLIDTFEKVARELGSGASEARLKKAFRDALVAEGLLTRSTTNTARDFNRTSLPLFERAQQLALDKQLKDRVTAQNKADVTNAELDANLRKAARAEYVKALRQNEDLDAKTRKALTAEYDKAHRFNEDMDAKARKADRAEYVKALRQNADVDAKARKALTAEYDKAHRVNDDRDAKTRKADRDQYTKALRENADLDAKTRKALIGEWDKAQRANIDLDSKRRLAVEAAARKQVRADLRVGGLDRLVRDGDTDGANQLLSRSRRTLRGNRPDLDDEFIDSLFKASVDKVSLAKGVNNLKDAETELRRLFSAINSVADAAERARIRDASIASVAAARGVNPNTLRQGWDDQEGVRDRRNSLVPPAPEREARQPANHLSRFRNRLQTFTDYAGIGAVVGAVGYTASQTVALEKSLKTLQAISGATNTQMAELATTISEVGQSSAYTLTELSAAATTLAQAGYSAQQVAKVLPDIKNLALASGSDINDSTAILSSVMTIFEKGMSESAYVSDVLTQALNGSKLSLEQFSLGVQYAGNIAADSGITFEEMAATLGAVSNAGIKSGSTLGTGFRAMLQELQAPSEKFLQYLEAQGLSLEDVDVRARGILPVLETLKATGFDSQQALAAFDVRAASFYSAASRNLDVASAMQAGFAGNGAAAIAAAQQMDTLSAQLTRLGNATIDLTTSVGGPLLDALKGLAGGLADVFTAVAKSPKVVQALAAALITYGAATAIAGVATTSFGVGLGRATAAMVLFSRTLLASPMGWLALGASALAAGMVLFSNGTQKAANAAEELKNRSDELDGQLTENAGTISELDKFSDQLTNTHVSLAEQVQEAERRFGQYGLVLDDTITTTEQLRAKTDELTESLRRNQIAKSEEQSVVLGDERKALQSVGARGIVSAADRAGFGISPMGTTLRSNANFKAIAAGEGTAENYRALLAAVAAMESTATAGERRALERFERAVLLDGNYLALSQNQTSTTINENTLRQSRIEGAPAFGSFERGLAARSAESIIPRLGEGGRLKPEFQANYDNVVVPLLEKYLEDTIKAIVAQTPSLAGQEADIRLNLQSQPEYADLMALRTGHVGTSRDSQRRARENLEARWKSASPQERATIEPQLRRAYDREYARENQSQQYTTIDQANATNERMQLLTDSEGTRQGGRSQNRALAQNTANARSEAELAAARVNTGIGRAGSGRFIRPIDAAEGSPFGATAGRTGPHRGSDYPAGIGTQVVAPMGGMASSGFSEANGNFVRIDHGNGFESVLIHLDEAAAGLSAVAKQVEQGQEVGRSGNTGASRGPHLHWQLKLNGEVIDPESMVGQQAVDAAAEIISTAQEDFEGKWQGYVTARLAQFEDQTSEMTADDKAQERTALMNDLALEKAEMLKKNLADVYAVILANFEIQAEDAVQYALAAAARGEDSQVLEGLARAAITRQRDAAVAAARASMEDGDAEDTAVAGIMRDYAGRLSGLTVSMLEAATNHVARQAEREARTRGVEFSIRQGGIDARSNPNAQRNGSRALDIIHGRDAERLAEDRQREEVRRAQSIDDIARRRVSDVETALKAEDLNPGQVTELQATLQAAQDAAFETAASLKEAEISLSSMTAEAEVFRTPMEAIRGSWDAFIEQANLGRPVLSTLADGLLESFKGAKEGFKTLIVDVLSGTKSMGDAFKDLAVSILGSLLDLAAEILAQQLLTMIITSLIPGGFGGGAKTGLGGKSGAGFGMKPGRYQGGMIPRRAAGGMAPSPNRDSVMTFMQPGEFVMSKTATDFIGADTLSEMNASGNRRMKNLPTVASSMPKRVPDEVNVWVVPPTQRPPMGKKDIIAAVTDDMMMNGQTKRLIKAIQVGAM